MAIILDIGILMIIFLTIYACYRRGLVRTLLGIACNIASIIGAIYISDFISKLIYDGFIKQNILDSVSKTVDTSVGGSTQTVHTAVNNLPDSINTLLGMFGYTTDSLDTELDKIVNKGNVSISEGIESIVAPIVICIISFVLIIILFVLFRFLLGKLSKLIIRVANLPLIGTVNRLCGGLLGIADGFVLAYFVTAVVVILFPVITSGSIVYDDFVVYAKDSYVFSFFFKDNFIIKLVSG